MIFPSIRGKDLQAMQEGEGNGGRFSKGPSTSRQRASGVRNPRVVRVSHSFGGKDRHSKVATVRGLRDRRIRLSVPTAIQLYDLQDRLGLTQPSKVVDWLLDVAKDDIDTLPPLQMPPGDFVQSYIPMPSNDHKLITPFAKDGASHSMFSSMEGAIFTGEDQTEMAKSRRGIPDDKFQSGGAAGQYNGNSQLHVVQTLLPSAMNHGSFAGLQDNSMPYTPLCGWEAPNSSLSQVGTRFGSSQIDQDPHSTALMFQSSMPFPSLFPKYAPSASHLGSDQRPQVNQFQLMSSTSQSIALPFPRSIASPPESFPVNVHPKILLQKSNAMCTPYTYPSHR